jgi:hypothetical protein
MNDRKVLAPLDKALWSVFDTFTPDLKIRRYDGDKPLDRFTARWGNYKLVPPYYAYGNAVLPTAELRELGGWDENYSGAHGFWDVDMSFRLHALGWKAIYDEQNPVYHFMHGQAFQVNLGEMKKEYFHRRLLEIFQGKLQWRS